MRLSDDGYVSEQYRTSDNLETRMSVWQAGAPGRSPQDLALKALREARAKQVLEVGSGTGGFAARMSKEIDCEVVAIDSSAAMVSASRSLGVAAILADVRELPFRDESFDAVVAAWMLYHVSPLNEAIEEIARVLRRGGRLVAITNGRDHLAELWRAVETEHREPAFSVENGAAILQAHFAFVEQYDVAACAVFEDRATAAAYLRSLEQADLVERLPQSGWPLLARGATTVFVASGPL